MGFPVPSSMQTPPRSWNHWTASRVRWELIPFPRWAGSVKTQPRLPTSGLSRETWHPTSPAILPSRRPRKRGSNPVAANRPWRHRFRYSDSATEAHESRVSTWIANRVTSSAWEAGTWGPGSKYSTDRVSPLFSLTLGMDFTNPSGRTQRLERAGIRDRQRYFPGGSQRTTPMW